MFIYFFNLFYRRLFKCLLALCICICLKRGDSLNKHALENESQPCVNKIKK